MIARFIVALALAAKLFAADGGACVIVNGDQIVAGDLATAVPSLSAVPADTKIALAPLPGVRRVFRQRDLLALGTRFGIAVETVADFCVERETTALDSDGVLEALRRALALPEARIEIVELSGYKVPRGRIEFKRDDLHAPPGNDPNLPVEWRGAVVYGDARRFSIWARVKISASVEQVLAAENLRHGQPISASQLRVESVDAFPDLRNCFRAVAEAVGRKPIRDVAAGEILRPNQTVAVADVARGDVVDVEVRNGAARLLLTGKAESAGSAGDVVAVRNTSSNKLFQARVLAKGKVLVDARGENN